MIDVDFLSFIGDLKPLDWWNLGISAAGLMFSIFAFFKARGAKRAVESVIRLSAQQSHRDSAQRLFDTVETARVAAMRRKGVLGLASHDGRSLNDLSNDVEIIGAAQDALAIRKFDDSDELNIKMKRSSEELEVALDQIKKNRNDPNGWALALRVLQGITPHIEKFINKSGSEMLEKK